MVSAKRYLVGTLLIILSAILLATGISAAQSESANSSFANSNRVYDRTIYRLSDELVINDVVNGDLFCAGNNIVVQGIISGDVICAGNNITIAGSVNGNVRLAAKSVELTGDIEKNVTIAAGDVSSIKGSTVGGDVTIVAKSANLDGDIGRDLSLRANSVRLFGEVGRNVQSYHSSFTFDGDAKINGDFKYASPNRVFIPNGAVEGSVTQETTNPSTSYSYSLTSTVFIASLLYIAWFISLLIAALGVAFLFPKSLEDSVNYASSQFFTTLFAGLLALLVTPGVLIFLMLSIIGIPLALIIAFLFGATLLLSTPFVAHLIGSLLLPNRSHPIKALAGATILLLLYAIPVINIISVFFVTVLGTGMVIRVAAQRYSIAHRQYYQK